MRKIKTIGFKIATALCDFINNHRIEQKDIQQIIVKDGFIELFYWGED